MYDSYINKCVSTTRILENQQNDGEGVDITTDSETNVPISRDILSSFSVRIPQSINFTSGNDVAGFTVEVKGNIRADEELKVTVPASIAITAENDAGYTNTATVAIDTSVFGRDVINNDTYTVVNGSVAFNETKADTYKGNVNFKVALENTIKKVLFKYEVDGVVEERTVVEGTTVGEVFDCSKLYENTPASREEASAPGKCQIAGTDSSAIYYIEDISNGSTTRPLASDVITNGAHYARKTGAITPGARVTATIDVGEIAKTVTASLYDNGDLVIRGSGMLRRAASSQENFLGFGSSSLYSSIDKVIFEGHISLPSNCDFLFTTLHKVKEYVGFDKVDLSNINYMNMMFNENGSLTDLSFAQN